MVEDSVEGATLEKVDSKAGMEAMVVEEKDLVVEVEEKVGQKEAVD